MRAVARVAAVIIGFIFSLFGLLVVFAFAGWLLPLLWLASRKDSAQVKPTGEKAKMGPTTMDSLLMAFAVFGLLVAAVVGIAVTWHVTDVSVSNTQSDIGSAIGALGAVGVGAIGGIVIYLAVVLSSVYLYGRLRRRVVGGAD